MTTTSPKKSPNIGAIVIIVVAVAINLVIAKLMATWSYSWFPPQASTAAPYVDDLFALGNGDRLLHLLRLHRRDGLGPAVQPGRQVRRK